ncbi:MAG: hypothetical protein ING19_01495 [Azospirillum sp.]|nr:hypothetical protein [Azospirillum sp.]
MKRNGPDRQFGVRIAAPAKTRSKRARSGEKFKNVSVRIPIALLEEARRISGIERDGDLVRAGLVLLAKQNSFGAWLIANGGKLPDHFDLDI